jgi:hypothetical protein
MAGSSVDDCLNSLYVRLPCSVGSSVRMRNLDTICDLLFAKLTFCHYNAPPLCATAENMLKESAFSAQTITTNTIISHSKQKCKLFSEKNIIFL